MLREHFQHVIPVHFRRDLLMSAFIRMYMPKGM
jgi:hypothetical protein